MVKGGHVIALEARLCVHEVDGSGEVALARVLVRLRDGGARRFSASLTLTPHYSARVGVVSELSVIIDCPITGGGVASGLSIILPCHVSFYLFLARL